MKAVTSFLNDMLTMSDKLDNANAKVDGIMSAIAEIKQRLSEIVDNAPKAEVIQKPTAEVVKLVSKNSPKTFGTELGFWTWMLKSGGEDSVLLWKNGSITSFGFSDTKNPIAVFSSRHKARLTLRSAGWDVPYSYGPINTGKYVIATRK
jgi:hypothetical protein